MKSSPGQIPIRSRGVAAVILAGRGEGARVLVLQRNKNTSRGLWSLVMGRLEKGESAAEAVRREIVEETGIQVEALYTTGCVDAFFNAGANSIEMMPSGQVGRPPTTSLRTWRSISAWLMPA